MKSSYKIFRFSSLIFRNVIVPFKPLGANIFIMLDFLINMHFYVFSLAIKLTNQWPILPKINQPFLLPLVLLASYKQNKSDPNHLLSRFCFFEPSSLQLCSLFIFLAKSQYCPSFKWLMQVQLKSCVFRPGTDTKRLWIVMELIVNNDGYLWGRGGNFVTMLKGLRLTFEHCRDSVY